MKPPKVKKKRQKQVRFSEKGNRASQKEWYNDNNDNDHKIYASMARMFENDKSPSRDLGDSS